MFLKLLTIVSALLKATIQAADLCDDRYCYFVHAKFTMSNINDILDVCQSASPSSRLLTIEDTGAQSSVKRFFVDNLTTFDGDSDISVPLALYRNDLGQWMWLKSSDRTSSTPASFTNWKDGNPLTSYRGSDCAFFTPRQGSQWWNALCSQSVTAICMRDRQNTATIRMTPTNHRGTRTTPEMFTSPETTITTSNMLQTPAAIPSTHIMQTLTTTTTTTTTATTTTTTITTATTTTATITTATTTIATTTTTTSTSKPNLPSSTTSTTISTNIPSSSSSPPPLSSPSTTTDPIIHEISEKKPSSNETIDEINQLIEKDRALRRNLGIGLGIGFGGLFLICLISVLIFCLRKKKNNDSKFSSVTDIDRTKYNSKKSAQETESSENVEDPGSSDSGYDHEEARLEINNIDDTPPPLYEESIHDEVPEIDISDNRNLSVESGLDNTPHFDDNLNNFDWDYSTTTSSKKSLKKVTFDVDVVEIPS